MSTGLVWAASLPLALENDVTNGLWSDCSPTEGAGQVGGPGPWGQTGDAAGLEPCPLLENLQSCRSAYLFKRGSVLKDHFINLHLQCQHIPTTFHHGDIW